MITPDQFRFFLDSGAYSAWSRGTVIDLDEYCAFIRANIDHIEVYASLDVIPGVPGRAATTAERNNAAEQSWDNYLYMKSEGLDPIPVFHYGEDDIFLKRMLKHGCSYIGIGGLVSVPSRMRRHWLDHVFTMLTDASGMPTVKTHGFGMTAIPLVFRYPWYSIDSTTWIKITANGAVYLPQMRDGQFVFDQIPEIVSVSAQNPKQGEDGKHYNSMSPSMKKHFHDWILQCGKTHAEVSTHYYHRAVCNVTFFKRLSETRALHPFNNRQARQASIL